MTVSDFEAILTNPDGTTVEPVLVEDPVMDDYLDKPRRFTLKIEKPNAANPQAWIKISRKGTIKLIGHITKMDQSKTEYDTLICDSAEALLSDRIAQFYRYPAGTSLNSMLASSMGGSVVGLLAMANGLIPRGAWEVYSGSVYYIAGAGTSSRFGTVTSMYQNATLLTKGSNTSLSAGRWWQDASNLYLRTTTSASPDGYMILVPNFKDTRLRLGTISGGTDTFTVAFEVGPSEIWPVLQSLLLAKGLEWDYRYEKDGYVYLDASSAVGRGSSSAPVQTYIDGKNAEIGVLPVDGGRLQALIGQGAGAGMTQQAAASIDVTTLGTWREEVYSSPSLFGEMLQDATDKVFADRQDGTIYTVDLPEADWGLGKGDYVQLIRGAYQPVIKRVKHIRAGSNMVLEAGQRLRTLAELIKGDQEVQRLLNSFYSAHTKNAWRWSFGPENVDSYTAITQKFKLGDTSEDSGGSGEIDPAFPYQVLLNLTIGWFTSDTYSASNSSQSHSNVGSHGGYGGNATTNAGGQAHAVSSFTDNASNQTSSAIWYINDADSHSHGVYYTSTMRTSGYSGCLSGCSGHAHYHNDYYPTGTDGAGGHGHSSKDREVAGAGHTHLIPSHDTNTTSTHPHTDATESAKTRAGSSAHPEWDAVLEGLLKQYGTGNSVHYLTLSVKVNGVAAPGSPFTGGGTGLYVGDSLDAIDISDLVTVGGTNTLTLEISEFGGSSVVRCSLQGDVSVNAVISAF